MTQPIADVAPVQMDHRARMEILGAIMLTMFLSALDQTIVGTALPRIVTDLNGNALYVWVVTVYLLAVDDHRADLRQALRPVRPAADHDDRRQPLPHWIAALWPVAGDVAAHPVPWHPGPGRRRDLPDLARGHRRPLQPARAWQVPGAVRRGLRARVDHRSGFGRPPDRLVSWHWVFLVNLPLGTSPSSSCGGSCRPIRQPERVISIDYLGAAVFAAALIPLLIGLTNKQFNEWTDPLVGGLIAVGLLLSAVFVWVESRAPNRSCRSTCSATGR